MYPFSFENGGFFLPVWPTVHTHPVKTVNENASFQKRSLKRGLLVYARTDENGDFRNTCDDIIN